MDGDNFETIRQIAKFKERYPTRRREVVDTDSPAFFHVTSFFSSVIEALTSLGPKIKLEIMVGELQSTLVKMRVDGEDRRASQFPTSYTRMWLSNVPYVLIFSITLLPSKKCIQGLHERFTRHRSFCRSKFAKLS